MERSQLLNRLADLIVRVDRPHPVRVAIDGVDASINDEIGGMIEIRDNRHISLLFVEKKYHRRGISKKLFQRALKICLRNRPDLSIVSVNSSPYTVEIYKKLGFIPDGPEMVRNGIRFVPMKKQL